MDKNKKIILLILILGWMGFIYYLSNQPANVSANQSGGFIQIIIEMPIIGIIAQPILTSSVGEFIIRKSAHMFLYLVLGILVFNYVNSVNKNTIQKNIIIALIVVFIYACIDEIHQLFIPGRSGEVRDVIVDTTGGIIGLLLTNVYIYIKRKRG